MRALLLAFSLSLVATAAVRAGDTAQRDYHGFMYDVSEVADRQDRETVEKALQHQFDIVDNVKLSPRLINYFHTIPVIVDEMACFPENQPTAIKTPLTTAACYSNAYPRRAGSELRQPTVWDSRQGKWLNPDPINLAEDTNGLVMVRPLLLDPKRPVLLHEYMHAFHARMLPRGYDNQAIVFFYNAAKKKDLFPPDEYFLANEREFFAVTASVFLSGSETIEPFTRDKIKEKLPEYYKYLMWLFEVNPEKSAAPSPVAMAN